MSRSELDKYLGDVLEFYNMLNVDNKTKVLNSIELRKYTKGEFLFQSSINCLGLIIVSKGQLRVHTINEDGKEITLYRLLERDSCILSAGCILKDISFDIAISFEKDSEIYIIPAIIFDDLNKRYIDVKNFTLNLVSSRFTDVMWLLEQYMFKGTAQRLANIILEHSTLSDNPVISVTHEDLARDVGTAREVVTRLMKRLSYEGIVKLSRGTIEILDYDALKSI